MYRASRERSYGVVCGSAKRSAAMRGSPRRLVAIHSGGERTQQHPARCELHTPHDATVGQAEVGDDDPGVRQIRAAITGACPRPIDQHRAVRAEDDVVGMQVAMQDTEANGTRIGIAPLRHPRCDPHSIETMMQVGQHPANTGDPPGVLAEAGEQRWPVDAFHDQVRASLSSTRPPPMS